VFWIGVKSSFSWFSFSWPIIINRIRLIIGFALMDFVIGKTTTAIGMEWANRFINRDLIEIRCT
jgi:hypothetical protein